MLTLLILLVALALILIAIVKYDIHPFLALFVGAIIYGLMMQMPTDLILKSISEGFGGVMGSVGLLILLGIIMGTFLDKTGGALVIADRILKWIGEKFVTLSLMLSGWILSIPIFLPKKVSAPERNKNTAPTRGFETIFQFFRPANTSTPP